MPQTYLAGPRDGTSTIAAARATLPNPRQVGILLGSSDLYLGLRVLLRT